MEPMQVVRIEATPQWLGLKTSPQFQLFLKWLDQTAQEHMESWAARQFESDDPHVWQRNNAAALGRVSMCRDIIEIFAYLDQEKPHKQEKVSDEQ